MFVGRDEEGEGGVVEVVGEGVGCEEGFALEEVPGSFVI